MVGRDGSPDAARVRREIPGRRSRNRSGAGKPSGVVVSFGELGIELDGSFQFGKGVRVVLVLRVGLAEKVVDAGVAAFCWSMCWNIFAASATGACGRVRCPRRRGVRDRRAILPQGRRTSATLE